jgi:hypothetical protein
LILLYPVYRDHQTPASPLHASFPMRDTQTPISRN